MRLRPVKESGTSGLACSGGVISSLPSSWLTPAPIARRISAVIWTSPTSGTLVMVLGPSPRMAATMCLVTAFLEPKTSTSPIRGPLGWMNHSSDTPPIFAEAVALIGVRQWVALPIRSRAAAALAATGRHRVAMGNNG